MPLHKTDDFAANRRRNRIESNRIESLGDRDREFRESFYFIFSPPPPIETRPLIVPRRCGVRPVGRNGGRRLWQRSDRVEAEETR